MNERTVNKIWYGGQSKLLCHDDVPTVFSYIKPSSCFGRRLAWSETEMETTTVDAKVLRLGNGGQPEYRHNDGGYAYKG
jgi:hypothetical protein